METLQTTVVIIGAGPTGLMAACQLARFNIPFIIIDSKSGPTEESRALVVTSRSMEIYEQMDLSEEVIKNAAPVKDLGIYIEGSQRLAFPVGEIGKGLTDFTVFRIFEQSKNEHLLYAHLKDFGHEVNWNTEFKTFVQDQNNVTVSAVQQDRQITISAQYLIACDGAKSLVRHQLDMPFKGGTYENKFYVADVDVEWEFPRNRLILSPGYENFCGFFPMEGRKVRALGTLPPKFADKEDVTFEDIESSITKDLKFPVKFGQVYWFSVYKLHHRVSAHFRAGRCFLAGDAAHIHTPAGGQGMNTGLQDAYNLCWKLAMVVNGKASEKLLNTYEEERMPFAEWLLKFTDRAFNIMTKKGWWLYQFRKFFMTYIAKYFFTIERFRKMMFAAVSQTRWSYIESSLSKNYSSQTLKFNAGDRFPYFIYEDKSIYQQLKGNVFHLLEIGDHPANAGFESQLKTKYKGLVEYSFYELTEEWKQLGIQRTLFILVRPDNYIGMISDRPELNMLDKLFGKKST